MHGLKTVYGLFELVLMNLGLFIFFACGFFKPHMRQHWRHLGPLRAFVKALFVEMYGAPLTIYLASGWFQPRLPGIEWLSHQIDRLLQDLLGLAARPHVGILMILGFLVIAAGSLLVGAAWKRRYRAEQSQTLATGGPYACVRHPLYVGLLTIAFGVLLQCPTLVTLVMFSALVVMYARLAREEEKEAIATFDGAYRDYMNRVPAFIPDWRQP